jgi:endonuclease YncB( thermonuclease family)
MRARLTALLLTLLATSALLCAPAGDETEVVSVADGDTLTIRSSRGRERLRLAAIDAPERDQNGGTESGRSLSALVKGQRLTLERTSTDSHDRVVGRLLVDGKDVGLEQIRRGWAWHYRSHANEQRPEVRRLYADAEREARAARRGIWQIPGAEAPWEFRHRQRLAPASQAPVLGNRRTMLYHLPHCRGYAEISAGNRVPFASIQDAERGGYRRARNCR